MIMSHPASKPYLVGTSVQTSKFVYNGMADGASLTTPTPTYPTILDIRGFRVLRDIYNFLISS